MLIAAACAAAISASALAQTRPRGQGAPAVPLLDVPFIPQSESLCGGAAAAMVMRYWGAADVYAESFEPLIDPAEHGIKGDALLGALRQRGWEARSFRGDAALVRSHLTKGRPIVALIEDRPSRFHYVVIVSWPGRRVVVHDPARGPFHLMDEDAFVRAWRAADFWTMLVVPTAATRTTAANRQADEAERTLAADAPCAAMVDEGVRLANADDRDGARRLFETATQMCPRAAGPWRELAGLHAVAGEWKEAAADAQRAVSRDPADRHAWRILATARYVEGDRFGALDAWNHLGEPAIDLIDIDGLERTRFDVARRAVDLRPQMLLTASALRRAERRLSALPSVRFARLTYRPGENGRTQVNAVVMERPLLPSSPVSMVAAGVRAVSDREVGVALASPTGGGEVWDVAWRWWEHRPRVAAGLSAPGPGGTAWRIEAFDERETFGGSASPAVERRRGVAVRVADWASSDTRWDIAIGVDRWRVYGRAVSVTAGIDQRVVRDRVLLSLRSSRSFGDVRAWTAGARVDWRSSAAHEGNVLLAGGGFAATGRDAPFMLGHGAGTERGSDALLRAHPTFESGIVERAVFGRRLVHGGVEWRHWIQPRTRPLRFAPAVFVDAARASDGWQFSDGRAHVDVGAGMRLPLPGAGVVRVDIARGLRDGATALSVGWINGLR